MAERALTITHRIGATGRLHLSNTSGSVRINGTDGDSVEIRARYRAPAGIDSSSDPLDDGVLLVTRIAGLLLSAIAVQLVADAVRAFIAGEG